MGSWWSVVWCGAIAGIVGLTACGTSLQPSAGVSASKSGTARGAVNTTAVQDEASVDLALVCDNRKPCTLQRRYEAGRSESGARLTVLKIALGSRFRGKPGAGGPCEQVEYWLVEHGTEGGQDVRRVLDVCNDTRSDEEPTEVSVGPNAIEFSHVHTGPWMVAEGAVLQLSPMKVLSTNLHGWSPDGPSHAVAVREEQGLRSHVSWFAPSCAVPEHTASGFSAKPSAMRPKATDVKPVGTTASDAMLFEYEGIPTLELNRAFTQSGWQSTAPSACALTVGGSSTHGWLAYGADEMPAASLSVVSANDGTLFVEVHPGPDAHAANSASAPRSVNLELWTAPELPSPSSGCVAPTQLAQSLTGWSISPEDGTVTRIHGSGHAQLHVQRITDANDPSRPVRLRIDTARTDGALSLVLIEREGKARVRAVATSHFVAGRAETLGTRNEQVDGRCEASGRALTFLADEHGSLARLALGAEASRRAH